jgi:hypothetical protein
MIECHLLDSWTAAPYRESPEFRWAIILGGFGAPLFLFLAGAAVALAAGSRFRRGGDARAAAGSVVRRGLEIFALAFLFRLQAVVVSWGAWGTLLKVRHPERHGVVDRGDGADLARCGFEPLAIRGVRGRGAPDDVSHAPRA